MRDEGVAVAAVAGQPVRRSEREEVLVPVGLPDDLVVARRRVEIGDGRPVRDWRTALVNRVEVPVRRTAEQDVAVAKQVVAAVDDAIRSGAGCGDRVGEALTDLRGELTAPARLDRPGRGAGAEVLGERAMGREVIVAPRRRGRAGHERTGAARVEDRGEPAAIPSRRMKRVAQAAGDLARLGRRRGSRSSSRSMVATRPAGGAPLMPWSRPRRRAAGRGGGRARATGPEPTTTGSARRWSARRRRPGGPARDPR